MREPPLEGDRARLVCGGALRPRQAPGPGAPPPRQERPGGGSSHGERRLPVRGPEPPRAPSRRRRPSPPRGSPARGPRVAPSATPPRPRARSASPAPEFLATESWASLGVSPRVTAALERAGFPAPARLQAKALPAALSGETTVIAAETGSGKTLAYGIPVVEAALRLRAEAEAADGDAGADPAERRYRLGPKALVLLPTGVLCDQVVGVLHSLLGDNGAPLVEATRLSTSHIPSYVPDVLVTTPAALEAFWNEVSPGYPQGWMSRDALLSAARTVVLDEADLVLTASARATERVLEILRLDDRERTARTCMAHLGLGQEEWHRMSSRKKQVAHRQGVGAFLEAEGAAPRAGVAGRGFAWARQYVFVGATIPDTGERGVASSIVARVPGARWVEGDELHRSKAAVSHEWVRVDDFSWAEALVSAVGRGGGEGGEGGEGGRTMVFAAGKGYADEAAETLARGTGRAILLYHNGVPAAERERALSAFRETPGAVLVCTDSASRGLDIPEVTHVVQADFASTAVDFLHRSGRTARAGATGRVTSLYTEGDERLAGAIQLAIARGRPVEACFSRNRSFRKKVKRKGQEFVEGQIEAGPQRSA